MPRCRDADDDIYAAFIAATPHVIAMSCLRAMPFFFFFALLRLYVFAAALRYAALMPYIFADLLDADAAVFARDSAALRHDIADGARHAMRAAARKI